MVGKRISLERNIPTANKQELSETLERTALCSFFAMGKCLRGKDCKFAHEVAQIRPKPDLTRTSLCHDFMRKGSCKSGNKCKYAHGEAQLRGPGKEQTLPPKPRTVGSPLLWDPLGLDEGSKELNELKELKEPIAPVSTLIPVLQRLMGKRTPQKTPPKTMSTPLAPVEEQKPAQISQPGPTALGNDFLAQALPEALSSHPFKVVLRADGQITCAEAVDVYPGIPKDLAFPIHVKNTFLDFDTEIPPCDFVRFCTEPADLGRVFASFQLWCLGGCLKIGSVQSEAEKLKPKLAAEGAITVAKSMIRELVDRAAEIKDPKEKREALDKVVMLSDSSQSLASSVAADVEVGTPVYDGPLRYKTLEQMFDVYLDGVMDNLQQNTKAMMQAFTGGEESGTSVAEMTARAEQAEKAQSTLAAIFKISDGKVQKLVEKKAEKVQKDLLGGILSGEA
ncbi:unnamed protein product [Symbiodinium natans]|uniref:C3H1-type domain-containing protein n=1 Tax=Symbiodinium natans TaxID=878477 RepID=A0A812UZN6_9DINO|nr:unnamed protein product [Symbiodinium natans]